MLKGLVGSDGQALMAASEAYMGYRDFAIDAIGARRAVATDDLLSVLVHAEVDGDRLDDESLIAESLLILIGGDETTRHVISGGMYQLLANPDEKQKLVDDPAKIPCAVEEMLRWVSPIKNMSRTVVADVSFAGQDLRAGDKVLLVYPSANRDEDVFDDPFRFDVERQPNEHVAFGFGTHFCLGNSLARLELVCMMEHVLSTAARHRAGDAHRAGLPAGQLHLRLRVDARAVHADCTPSMNSTLSLKRPSPLAPMRA